MKILVLGDASVPHTINWINGLKSSGIEVSVFSLSNYDVKEYSEEIDIYSFGIPDKLKMLKDGAFKKINYLKALPAIKRIIKLYEPDILHAFYASSYGFLGALTRFKPFFTSVWGNDVFDFPKKSFINSKILSYTLNSSDKIFSTSKIMAKETQLYTSKKIDIIPYGINLSRFSPEKIEREFFSEGITIGTVKSLNYNYGIEYLIEAFSILIKSLEKRKLNLLIVGGGPYENKLKKMCVDLAIHDFVKFVGQVQHKNVDKYHNQLDIAVYPSRNESFGVSILESMACQIPVIASNVGGIPEIIENGKSGILFESQNVSELVEKLKYLIENSEIMKRIAFDGRLRVKNNFNFEVNLREMINYYKDELLRSN